MTKAIDTIQAIASDYDVIVFDQWGVLHNGSMPYPGALGAIAGLDGKTAVLSNSGKRSAPNLDRIAKMGFDTKVFDFVMTSGEALWRDVQNGVIDARSVRAIERADGDAANWAEGLDITLTNDENQAEAILLMGLPDRSDLSHWIESLETWKARGLTVYCSNPDRQSPRAGRLVISPGALAFAYTEMGGNVVFYGKPYLPVFKAVEQVFGSGRYLMVGDSMEHDIAGAQSAGWDSLLIEGGLYAERFAQGKSEDVLIEIAREKDCNLPTYRSRGLR